MKVIKINKKMPNSIKKSIQDKKDWMFEIRNLSKEEIDKRRMKSYKMIEL